MDRVLSLAAILLTASSGLAFQIYPPQRPDGIPGVTTLPTIQTAAARGQTSVVAMLLKLGVSADTMDPEGKRALNIACLRGDAAIVELLLQHGANVNLRDGSGSVPLRDAALHGNRAVGELLLAHGAEIDARDPETGATPLYEAVSFQRADFAKLLIEKGAAVNVKTRAGKTILEAAEDNGMSEIATLLKKAAGLKKAAAAK